MGFCGGCAKALLIIFNFIFWLSGAAILGVGVWMIVDKNIGSYFDVLNMDSHDQFFKYAAYILIAFGVFVFLVGFCGCCGAIRGSKCLLGLYVFFLFIVFAGELCAGVLMIVYKVEIEDKLDTTLTNSIKEKYGTDSETTLTGSWDVVQIQLECCGGVGPEDYDGSKYVGAKTRNLPPSCCVLSNMKEAEEDPTKAMPKNDTNCKDKMEGYYHNKGCKDGLLDWAKSHTAILIGVGIGVACLQIFGIVFALCLCRQVDREEKY
ncbi:CD82 antigen-like [Ruditapes philippinarum]|uniref:CD82 antigen-like n=1 Tax=Ruditapes philippinarum TaxID=129788 RepID=UPI00295BC6C5|nr:CD82 antigen-like [Ruditapes philippinarum]XP_060573902.1 CD82 antigen-like [Ruditapes philippinarum]